MQEIRKLIRIVTNRADKNGFGIDLDVVTEYPSLEEKLFIGARDGLFMTDEDAAKGLYDSEPTDHRFRMLKSRLKSKLMNLLLLVDFKESTDKISWQYEQESENHLQRAKILFKNGEYEMAEKQLNKSLAISRECEFTSLNIEALRLLRTIYSERCKPTDFYRVVEEIEQLTALQAEEDKAENLYSKVNMNLRKSLHSRKNTTEEAGNAVKALQRMSKKNPSFNIFERYFMLDAYYSEIVGNYNHILEITDDLESKFKNNELNQLRFDVRYIYYIRAYAHLRNKSFDEGIKTASRGMQYFDRSSINWFSHMENYMSLALYSRSYKLASDLMQRVQRNPFLDKISPRAKERWTLYQAYLNFVLPHESVVEAINFDEFYISMSEYRKDKRGYNTAILILEFLHHLKEGNVDRVFDRIDSLLDYMKRHFSDPGQHTREKLFIKMLKSLTSMSFDPDKSERKGRKYYQKLKDEVDPGDAFRYIEIIPYEQLWEHIIELLKGGKVKLVY